MRWTLAPPSSLSASHFFLLYILFPSSISINFCTTFQVTILISDINDNRPVFDSSFYIAGVTEGTNILSNVITVTAQDKDISRNSRIQYSIIGGDSNGK